jgi:vanillin dehydrogenase
MSATSSALQTQLLIDGTWCNAESAETFSCIGPLSSNVVTQAAAAGVTDVRRAAAAAETAQAVWAATGPGERRACLLRVAEALSARAPDAQLRMRLELGASDQWAGFNVHLAVNMFREAAALTTRVSGEQIPSDVPGNLALAVRRPAGVVLGIAPWNAPLILAARAIATPLACGNAVILKASEYCPATQALVAEALCAAGLPRGTVSFITHSPVAAESVVAELIAHRAIRRINFTGSTRVGRIVAKHAAAVLKPVLLELGGKAPLIVLEDADIEAAVAAASFGAFMNQGQICMSTERLIVHHSICDSFVKLLAAKASSLQAAAPGTNKNAGLAAVVNEQAIQRISGLVRDAVTSGAKLLTGSPAQGTIMQPTVLDHVTPDMRIFHEETFGPIVCVTRVADDAEALATANASEFGLSAAVFSRDISRALRLAERIESGICHINGPTVHDEPQMPFGGTKASGYGRFGGTAGIDAFTELRWITIQLTDRHYPI